MVESLRSRPGWQRVDDIMRQGLGVTYPAASLIVQQRNEIRFQATYGWVDPEKSRWPVQADTLFDLASLTKLFTAVAFMTLVAAGAVALDTPVSEVVPEFDGVHPIRPGIDPHTKTLLPASKALTGQSVNARQVTFRHLLTHTSGLAAWDNFCMHQDGPVPMPHQVPAPTRRARLESFLASPRFVAPPGDRFLYSDLGFILLGEAIERLTNGSLPDYLARAVFAPLDMPTMTYNPIARGLPRQRIAPTEFCAWRKRRVWGEVHDENAACLGGVAGHAGLFGTAREIARLGQCFLHEGAPLLPPQLARTMVQNHIRTGEARRGLGWQLQSHHSPVGPAFGPRSFGHTGFTGVSLWIDPDRDLLVALLTNRVYFGRDGEAIARFRRHLHEAVIHAIDDISEKTS